MPQVIFKAGDDVSTDVIYPGRFMATVLPTETPQFAFADETALNTKLKSKQVPPGSVLLGGKNFGCGSSREQAVSCLKGHELIIVDQLEMTAGAVLNQTTGKQFPLEPMPQSRQAIIDAGGLVAYTRQRLQQAATA